MSDCDLCEREHVCDYKYKPCDCVHYRKFLPAPMTACGSCDGSGWKPYPLRCRVCGTPNEMNSGGRAKRGSAAMTS